MATYFLLCNKSNFSFSKKYSHAPLILTMTAYATVAYSLGLDIARHTQAKTLSRLELAKQSMSQPPQRPHDDVYSAP